MNALGFPALPPGGPHTTRSWWAAAWLAAVEESALDRRPLILGRKYARSGQIGPITVSPGRLAAATPYATVIRVEQLDGAGWDRFTALIAERAGYLAALGARELPADAEVIPGPGDLQPDCDCPNWEYPCQHAAALCQQVAWLMDADPYVLLLLRGRGETELLEAVRARTAGEPATQAFAAEPAPLPAPLPPGPFVPPVLDPAPGLAADALDLLAANAAARARELLHDPGPSLTVWQDTVRLAATHPDPAVLARLQRATERPEDLPRAVLAWQYGGVTGLDVFTGSWDPPRKVSPSVLADFDRWRNQWTAPALGVQLRYGRDGRWYPYREESGEWWPAGPPARDPAAALAEMMDP